MIEAKNLTKIYSSGLICRSRKKVVSDVSFMIRSGETIGIIGESGCGKTTLAKMVLRLIPVSSGQILLNGLDITKLKHNRLKPYRKKIQIMFQNPESSLNPRMKIYHCIAEVLRIHRMVKKNASEEKRIVAKLTEQVGLQPEHMDRYPFELSGGQVQRAVLSRVLALKPDLLVADEPTSMLDVSVQAQILTTLKSLQRQLNFAMLFIAHDLDVIKIMCDRIFVMYEGCILESGTTDYIYSHAEHPYTQSLMDEFYNLSRKKIFGSAA